MQAGSFHNQAERLGLKVAGDHPLGANRDFNLVRTVPCMKVLWVGIVIEHRNDDTQGTADLWHDRSHPGHGLVKAVLPQQGGLLGLLEV